MQSSCRYADVHCMTRYVPELVFEHARRLVEKTGVLNKKIIEHGK